MNVELHETTDTLLMVGGLALLVYVLVKGNLFKPIGAAADAATIIIQDAMKLPQNAITIIGYMTPWGMASIGVAFDEWVQGTITTQDIFNNAIQGKNTTYLGKPMLANLTVAMIYNVYHLYPNVTSSNWAQVAIANGAVFNSSGQIIKDTAHPNGITTPERG